MSLTDKPFTQETPHPHEQSALQAYFSRVYLLSSATLAYHSAVCCVVSLEPPVADLLKERERHERKLRHHDTLEADHSRAVSCKRET